MTPDIVRERIEQIRAVLDDPSTAHADEDALHCEVLRAIAEGRANDPAACAAAALETLNIEGFTRWYA